MFNSVAPTVNLLSSTFIAQPLCHGLEYRPTDFNYNESVEEELVDVTNSFNSLSRTGIAQVAGKILAPTMDSKGTIDIEHGWGEKRYSVSIIIEVVRGAHVTREQLTGFTSHASVSASGYLDPSMKITINDHTIIATDTISTAAGTRSRTSKVVTQKHIVSSAVEVGHNEFVHTRESIRPEDALAMASRATMLGVNADVDDSRTAISASGNETNSLNALGSNWLMSLLSGVTKTLDEDNIWVANNGTIASQARNEVVGGDNGRSAFMTSLKNETNFGELGYTTVAELMAMFPNFDAASNVLDMGGTEDTRNYTESAAHTTMNALVADQLANIIPTLLNRFALTEINFCITNEIAMGLEGVGSTDVSPLSARPMRGAEQAMRANATAMCSAISNDIVPVIFPYADCSYTIYAHFRVNSGSDITVRVNGSEDVPFHFPNYADCIKGTLATVNSMQSDAVATGIVKTIGSVKNNLSTAF